MKPIRVVARLDIKGPNLIKGVHLEGLRVIGDPQKFAIQYYKQGADELIYLDVVASLYGRNNLTEILERTVSDVFIPITVGGGISSIEDARTLFNSGADKVAVNTAAIKNPNLLSELAETFGSQSVVLSVEAKRIGPRQWLAFTDCGRERTSLDVIEWCQKAIKLGVGEILLTSIDQDGTCNGFDHELIQSVAQVVTVPIVASGGLGNTTDAIGAINAGSDAIAVASALHYGNVTVNQIKANLKSVKELCIRDTLV